jgi:hypothetical protein
VIENTSVKRGIGPNFSINFVQICRQKSSPKRSVTRRLCRLQSEFITYLKWVPTPRHWKNDMRTKFVVPSSQNQCALCACYYSRAGFDRFEWGHISADHRSRSVDTHFIARKSPQIPWVERGVRCQHLPSHRVGLPVVSTSERSAKRRSPSLPYRRTRHVEL